MILLLPRFPSCPKKYVIATTCKCLEAAFNFYEGTKKYWDTSFFFAQMMPDTKDCLKHLHSVGYLCLMCGDGSNNVGVLKQADVRAALSTGFGGVNVDKGEKGKKKKKKVHLVLHYCNT